MIRITTSSSMKVKPSSPDTDLALTDMLSVIGNSPASALGEFDPFTGRRRLSAWDLAPSTPLRRQRGHVDLRAGADHDDLAGNVLEQPADLIRASRPRCRCPRRSRPWCRRSRARPARESRGGSCGRARSASRPCTPERARALLDCFEQRQRPVALHRQRGVERQIQRHPRQEHRHERRALDPSDPQRGIEAAGGELGTEEREQDRERGGRHRMRRPLRRRSRARRPRARRPRSRGSR